MDYTKLFYWLVVADNAKNFFVTMVVIFTGIALISTLVNIVNAGSSDKNKEVSNLSRKWIWWSYPFMIFFWFLFIFTPKKKDALLIVAGGQTLNFLVSDESAKQIPAEISNFILYEVKEHAKQAKVELGIMSQKDKILESAKNMTTKELLEKIKVDTTFAKILLEK